MPFRVASNHLRLEGIQLGRALHRDVGDGIELAFERLILLVFVDVEVILHNNKINQKEIL